MATLMDNVYVHLLAIFLVIVALVYTYFNKAYCYWRKKGVECTATTIPFGSATKLFARKATLGGLLKEVYDKYKARGLRYVGFYIFTKPVLIPLDINLIKAILTKDFQHFTDHGSYVNEEEEPLTAHLFALKGQRWKHMRTKLTPTFTSGKMKMMFNTLVNCSNGFQDAMDDLIKKAEPIDIKDLAARYTTDVIGSCAFGLDCNSLKDPNSTFRQFGKDILYESALRGFIRFVGFVAPGLFAALRLKFMNNHLSNFIIGIVKETVNYRENNNIVRNDFMHLLIQLKNNVQLKDEESSANIKEEETSSSSSGSDLTIEQIAAQVFVFFVAGFETSSTTLGFCFFELVTNPKIQKKLRSEIKSVLAKHDNNITYDGIMSMTYMDKCIQETLRKYPPLPLLFRECTDNYIIPESNVSIEKGTRVLIPMLGVHHDPEFYPDPEKFDPERFSAENKTSREHLVWLPFGEGPRACIGLRFGLMQTKVALTALLKDYEFTLSDKTPTPLAMSPDGIVMSVKGGIWLNVQRHK